ncbi:hypothetical protein NO1_2111, partial [Candidatus Termititenax aidoneus]
ILLRDMPWVSFSDPFKLILSEINKITDLASLHEYVEQYRDTDPVRDIVIDKILATEEYTLAQRQAELELSARWLGQFLPPPAAEDGLRYIEVNGQKILLSALEIHPELEKTVFVGGRSASIEGAEATRAVLYLGQDFYEAIDENNPNRSANLKSLMDNLVDRETGRLKMPERAPETETKTEPPPAQKRLQDALGEEAAQRYTEALERHSAASSAEQTDMPVRPALDNNSARAATQAYIDTLTVPSTENAESKANFESLNTRISELESRYLNMTNGDLLAEIEKTRADFAKNPSSQELTNRAVALEREAYWRQTIDARWTDANKRNEVIPLTRRFRPGVVDLNDMETALKTMTVDDYIMQKADGGNPRDILNGFRLNNRQTLGILVQNAKLVLDAPCGEGKTIILQMAAVLKNWAGQKAVIATSHTGLAQDGLKDVNEMLKFFQLMQPNFKAGYIDFHSPDKVDVVRDSSLIYLTFETFGFQKIQDRAATLSGGKRVFTDLNNLHLFVDEGDLPTTKQSLTPMQLTVTPGKHSDLKKTFCLEIDKIAADMQKNPELYGLQKIDGKLIIAHSATWSAFVNNDLPKLLENAKLTTKVLQPYNRKAGGNGQHLISTEEFRFLAECQLAQSLMVNADIHKLGLDYTIGDHGKSIHILNTYTDEANIGSKYMAEFSYEFFGGLDGAVAAREMHRLVLDPTTKQEKPSLTDNKNLFLHSAEAAESMLVR